MTYYPPPVQPGPQFAPPTRRPREVSIFRAMVTAPFFSAKTFRDVAQNWRGIGVLYILLLILPQIAFTIRSHYWIQNWSTNQLPRYIAGFPSITISNGVASSTVEQPYLWKNPDNNVTLMALDTTGTWNSLDDVAAPALVTKTALYTKDANGQVQIHSLSQIPPGTYDSPMLQKLANSMAGSSGYFTYPIGVLLSWVWHIIVLLILGAFAMVFASMFHARISYGQGLRIGAVAMTTGLILNVFIWVYWLEIPWCKTIIGLINLGYVFYGVAVGLERGSRPGSGFDPRMSMPTPPAPYQGQTGTVPLPAPPP